MRSLDEIIDAGGRVFEPRRLNGGWTIPPGWGNIVWELVNSLEELNVAPFCTQMKEKFGGLRFYVDWPEHASMADREVGDALIEFVERLSYITCQDCGSPGKNRNRKGWYTVLCERCNADG